MIDVRRLRVTALAVLAVSVAAACAGSTSSAGTGAGADAADDRLRVVTTVAPITSIVANIGGGLVDITGIVPEGTNSHTFEPAPSVAELLATADLVFINGLFLEEPTKALAEQNLAAGGELVALGDAVLSPSEYLFDFSFPEAAGKPNPHLWTDPTYARAYAEVVRDELSEADPANSEAFTANYDEFAAKIEEFDAAMRADFATIPEGNKKLLTYHDAYAYFAETYGWEVVGAIEVANFEEPTPREVAALIDQVRAERVPAIFGSEVFPSPVLEQIGREAGVRYVDVLRDDDLPGAPGDPEHSWWGLMRFNYVTMVDALGGNATALPAFDAADVAEDSAEYPQ